MTRNELVQRLRDTSEIMARSANALYFYGGFSDRAVKHAEELKGAAEIVSEWAHELAKEVNVSATFPADISRDSAKTC